MPALVWTYLYLKPRQTANKNQNSVSKNGTSISLLDKACDFNRNFTKYHDVVISVARKTDGRHLADLFSAAGRLFEECFQRRWYRTAACYILMIAKLKDFAVSQYCALRLLQATLDESLHELAVDHFHIQTDSRSPINSYNDSTLCHSTPLKEQSAHVTSVKYILETRDRYLMSGKELSKLVAFVNGTQFDLEEYLRHERDGSACLENFSSGLELIGQKLRMDILKSRLDAGLLLSHMCSVKFKEWIVVLATLLRWTESHPAFGQYCDLLEERLSSVVDMGVKQC